MKYKIDSWLAVSAVLLLILGILMIYSTSVPLAAHRNQDGHHLLFAHLFHLLIALGACGFGLVMKHESLQKLTPLLLIGILVLLIMVLIPQIGHEVKGGRRWLYLFGVSLQPAEFLKVVLIVYVASFLDRKQQNMGSFLKGLTPSFLVVGVFLVLVVMQPDFGTAALIALTVLAMVYVGGARSGHIVMSLGAAGLIGGFLIADQAYRMRRLMAFMDPWEDPLDSGFQIIQSFIALGSGGWFGRGLGESRQKLFFLPDAHTDFIFAIMGEELGFILSAGVVMLFGLFLVRGYRIAQNAPSNFARYLAFGIVTLIGLQILFNLYVVTGLMPTKGLPLPFISSGGSNLLVTLYMTGVLLNISSQSETPE